MPPKKTAAPSSIDVGHTFPSVGPLTADDGSDVTLTDSFVLYVYPKAGTAGCTKQAMVFGEEQNYFDSRGYCIYGISHDKPMANNKWKAKLNLPYPLLSDEGDQFLQRLGVVDSKGSVARSVFVVEKGGKIILAERNVGPEESVGMAKKILGVDDDEEEDEDSDEQDVEVSQSEEQSDEVEKPPIRVVSVEKPKAKVTRKRPSEEAVKSRGKAKAKAKPMAPSESSESKSENVPAPPAAKSKAKAKAKPSAKPKVVTKAKSAGRPKAEGREASVEPTRAKRSIEAPKAAPKAKAKRSAK